MRWVSVLGLCFLTVACTEPMDPNIPDQPDEGLKADPNCESWTDEDGQEFFIEGATRYDVIDFDIENGNELKGTLQIMLFANEEWKEFGEDDCQVQWYASGTLSDEPGACTACDQRMDVNYAIDMTNTTCPSAFYEGIEQGVDSFDILYEDGQDAAIFFSSSGKQFTDEAWATNKRIWAVASRGCQWYGSSD